MQDRTKVKIGPYTYAYTDDSTYALVSQDAAIVKHSELINSKNKSAPTELELIAWDLKDLHDTTHDWCFGAYTTSYTKFKKLYESSVLNFYIELLAKEKAGVYDSVSGKLARLELEIRLQQFNIQGYKESLTWTIDDKDDERKKLEESEKLLAQAMSQHKSLILAQLPKIVLEAKANVASRVATASKVESTTALQKVMYQPKAATPPKATTGIALSPAMQAYASRRS